LIQCQVRGHWSELRADGVLVVERVTTRTKEFWTLWSQRILEEEMPVGIDMA